MTRTKDVLEKVPITFEPETGFLDDGETIESTGVLVTIELEAGTDDPISLVKVGDASVVGNAIIQWVDLGKDGCTYHLRAIFDTSLGKKRVISGSLIVRKF
jgi:hypothetical protein